MPFFVFIWDGENDEHVAEHGVSIDEFEQVVSDPDDVTISRSSGRPIAFGETADGRYIACVYEELDDGVSVYPVTAYEVDP